MSLTIDEKAYGPDGSGVARWNEMVVFVPYGVPGDRVQAEVTAVKPRYARARIVAVEAPSRSRVEPECPVFGRCGSCQWLNMAYEAQVESKTRMVREVLRRLGGVDPGVVGATVASPVPLGYRTKVQQMMQVRPTPDAAGRLYDLGFYAANSHDVVDCEACPLQSGPVNDAFAAIRRAVEAVQPSIHRAHDHGLRYIVVRSSASTGRHVVSLVASRREERVDALARRLRDEVPNLQGVVLNVNPDDTNVVFGKTWIPLWGEPVLEERLSGFTFGVSPSSFFQANVGMTEVIAEALADRIRKGPRPEKIFDLYCGVGVWSLVLAQATGAQVMGVEESPSAAADAKRNRDRNRVARCAFYEGAVEVLLPELIHAKERPDLVLVDPPRKGCDPAILHQLGKLAPRDFYYLSCNPASLARDLKTLGALGYHPMMIQPFDMFPQTYHVEVLAHLRKSGAAGGPGPRTRS